MQVENKSINGSDDIETTMVHSTKKIEDTESYKIFSGKIDYLTKFFEDFSDLISYNGQITSFITQEKVYILNSKLIDGAPQTLKGIKFCCSIGGFSDANTLVRKLRDDLTQYVYILNVIRLRKPFIGDNFKVSDVFNLEEFTKEFESLRMNPNLTDDEKALSAWFDNSVSTLPGKLKKKLEFENYMNHLKQNENVNKILNYYKLNEYWESLRKNLNNYVHNNGWKYSAQNSVTTVDLNLDVNLKNINTRTDYISSIFFILLLMVDSSLISSSDYSDYKICDSEPPENCQYWIAPFIQEFIDNKVAKFHPELKEFLRENNIHGMKID